MDVTSIGFESDGRVTDLLSNDGKFDPVDAAEVPGTDFEIVVFRPPGTIVTRTGIAMSLPRPSDCDAGKKSCVKTIEHPSSLQVRAEYRADKSKGTWTCSAATVEIEDLAVFRAWTIENVPRMRYFWANLDVAKSIPVIEALVPTIEALVPTIEALMPMIEALARTFPR